MSGIEPISHMMSEHKYSTVRVKEELYHREYSHNNVLPEILVYAKALPLKPGEVKKTRMSGPKNKTL